MITFTLCLLALIAGYFIYGRFIERVFSPDDRKTPALTRADGVDYIPLPTWKIFMIQFLNIAGLGPIFGAIMGAKFGTASYLWIVFGSIFAGAVHDYLAGMLSLRHDGESLPEIIGRYLGLTTKQVMRGFTVILMILVGAVFVAGPAGLLAKLTPDSLDTTFWIIVVFAYYIFATLLPVDKIIGKIYPLFAIALLFMAVGILVMLYVNHPALPEAWDGLQNTHPNAALLLSDQGGHIIRCLAAYLPYNVCQYSLWCHQRFPCYPKPSHGTLHDKRAPRTPRLLRSHDNRRHRSPDLGCRRHLLFPSERHGGDQCVGNRRCHHEELAGCRGRCAGYSGCHCRSYHQWRYGFPLGASYRGRFPGNGTKIHA